MHIHNGKLDATYHLIDPNVGDGELAKIEFKHPNVFLEIKLAAATKRRACTIEIIRFRYLNCETDHPQNVIEGLVISPNIEHLTRPISGKVRQLLATEHATRAGIIVQTEPLTGCGFLCLGDDVRIQICD